MDERVEFLEGEMARYVESLEVLSRQFNLMQRFIQIEFGAKFEKFYEEQEEAENIEKLGEEPDELSENEEDDYVDRQPAKRVKTEHGNGQSLEIQEDGDDEENDLSNGNVEVYDDDGDQDAVACPADLVAVQFEDNDEEDDEMSDDEGLPPPLPRQNGVRFISRNPSQSNGPQSQMQNVQKPSSSSVQSVGGQKRAIRPPPPLLRRPPAGTTIIQHRSSNLVSSSNTGPNPNPRFQRSGLTMNSNGQTPTLVINHNELPGTGNGKYAKYYKKVDAELIQCKICSKVLKRRGKFIQHLRTHTGEKPFCCEFCGASFSRKDNMNVHMTRHHSGPNPQVSSKSVSCQLCGSSFWNMRELNGHLQTVHGYTADAADEEENNFDDDDDNGQIEYYDDEDDEDEDGLVFTV